MTVRWQTICVLAGVASAACTPSEPTANAVGSRGACTPESLCGGCGACFDGCLCGGGTARRCAEACAESSTTDGGLSDAGIEAPLVATFATDAFDIPPGEEYFRCQNFSNPFEQDVVVVSSESFMTSGSHHLFVFQGQGLTDGALEPCGGLEFSGFVHLAQTSQSVDSYPPGVGLYVGSGVGFRVLVHYLNTSPDTVHTQIAVTLHAAQPSAVPVHASHVFINTISISVPPHSTGSAHPSCGVPKDINVIRAVSHMHRHGTYFSARATDGQLIYETNEWADPAPWRFDPPRRLKAGSTINLDCEYRNDTDFALSFGESAATNEMCILAGTYYPAADGESITCLF